MADNNQRSISTTTPQTRTSRSEVKPGETEHGRMVKMMFKVLTIDYESRFTRVFRNSEVTPKSWMGRLYRALKRFDLDCIGAAFESLIATHKEYPPTPREIILEAKRRHVAKQDSQRYRKADKVVSSAVPAKYLEHIKPKDPKETRDLSALAASHEEMIRQHTKAGKIKQPPLHRFPHCATVDCTNYGTVSSSLSGSDTWYCLDCFEQRKKLAD